MKPMAILYTSNTGHTRQYALMLGEQTGLPVYTLEEAKAGLSGGSSVIYLGWIRASRVQGYSKAARRYGVEAVCAVGPETDGRFSSAAPECCPFRRRTR